MASEAARTDAAITAAVAPFTEQLAVMATDIASESAAEAVKEATARVEQWKARAKRVEADLAASADAVVDLELAALEAKQQQAASKGSRGGTDERIFHKNRMPQERFFETRLSICSFKAVSDNPQLVKEGSLVI